MFIFKHGGKRVGQLRPNQSLYLQQQRFASRIEINPVPPPFSIVDSCPSPTCQCRETPAGLDIEREHNLNGSMAPYAEQVLISTGRSDWHSRIEEDEGSVLVRELKGYLGRHGKYSDPYHNVLLTNSSFPPTESHTESSDSQEPAQSSTAPASAFLLPSFQYIPNIHTDPSSVETLTKAFILPSQLHQSHDRLTRAQRNALKRQPELQRQFVGARKVDEILILICGHGNRDARCGTLGPILKAEFEDKLQRQNIALLHDPPVVEAIEVDTGVEGYTSTARVGLISHIGGHKWAGNVIIYIPPSFKQNPLAGKGIWYGRVGPEHVEGIVAKTIVDGKVIKDMFRGGIDQNREILRL